MSARRHWLPAPRALALCGHWLRGGSPGSAAMEMGLVTSLLMLLLGGALEFGVIIFQVMEVSNAVDAGMAYSTTYAYNCCSSSTFQQNVQNVIQNATGLGTRVSATNPASTFCGCPNGASPPQIVSTSCSARCTSGQYAGTYLTVSGSYNLVSNIIPWLPNSGRLLPTTLTSVSTVRIQ